MRHYQVQKVEGKGYEVNWKWYKNVLFSYCRTSRSPGKWQGQIFDQKFLNSRFCSENVSECRVTWCRISVTSFPL